MLVTSDRDSTRDSLCLVCVESCRMESKCSYFKTRIERWKTVVFFFKEHFLAYLLIFVNEIKRGFHDRKRF